jgi:hypothetical protein
MDGYSTIDAVIEISKDKKTNNVKESLRLIFKFRRDKFCRDIDGISHHSDKKQNNQTRITYDIEFSKDYGKKKQLLSIEVHAKNNYPSSEQALPMEDDCVVEEDELTVDVDTMDESKTQDSMSIVSEDKNDADRYCAYVDPESLDEFLTFAGLDLNAENSLFFLMTFPFYEHEWDIFGFLLDCVFGNDDESDGNGNMDDDISENSADS